MEDDFSWVGVFSVGDRVRVKPSVRNPEFGWGNVTHRNEGNIISMDDSGRCKINFGPTCPSWSGWLREMEKVPETASRSASLAPSTPFSAPAAPAAPAAFPILPPPLPGAGAPASLASGVSVGQMVIIMPGVSSGPLTAGAVGRVERVDQSDSTALVAVGARTWWYAWRQLAAAPGSAVPTPVPAPALPATDRTIREGSRVTLSPNFRDVEDAGDGPLVPGAVGVVVRDDRSEKPFQVSAAGSTWWYCREALVLAPEAGAAPEMQHAWHRAHAQHQLDMYTGHAGWSCDMCRSGSQRGRHFRCGPCNWDACNTCMASGGHSGDFRDQDKTQWCSLDTSPDGPICRHAEHIVTRVHWSCCGAELDGAPCLGPIPAAPAGAPTRFQVGDRVKLAPGFRDCSDAARGPLTPGDVGLVLVDDLSGKPYRVQAPSGTSWWYTADALMSAGPAAGGDAPGVAPAGPGSGAGVIVTRDNAAVGRHVRRGPDWKWGRQDGDGPGVISALDSSPGWVRVRWASNGETNTYRIGGPGSSDLVYCNAEDEDSTSGSTDTGRSAADPPNSFVHAAHPHRLTAIERLGYTCDVCRGHDRPGRHRCVAGCDWDACQTCMTSRGHRGEFRGLDRPQWCSIPGSEDGKLCAHGAIIQNHHWSCCGAERDGNGCFNMVEGRRLLQRGDLVTVTPNFADFGDAGGGPLRVGDVGIIVEADQSEKPYNVRAIRQNRTWWYMAAAITAFQGAQAVESLAKAPPKAVVEFRTSMCSMCLKVPVQAVNMPCGHMFLCAGCSAAFREASGEICVSCRSPSTLFNVVTSHECILCMDPVEAKDLFTVHGCGHTFCKLCMVKYIREALSDIAGQFPLRCPLHADKCKSHLEHARLEGMVGYQAIVPTEPGEASAAAAAASDSGSKSPTKVGAGAAASASVSPGGGASSAPAAGAAASGGELIEYSREVHDHVVRVTLEALIPADERVYCGNSKCARAMRKEKLPKLECIFCHSFLCGRCWTLDHAGITCDQAAQQRAGNDEATKQYISKTSKPCPKCKMAISHYRGHACHHIRPGTGCPNCGHHFCFACLRPHNDPECKCDKFCGDSCDCQDCPECTKGTPCAHCDNDGRCRVCRPPGSSGPGDRPAALAHLLRMLHQRD